MVQNYRYDVRTKDQFINDIKKSTTKEYEIAMLFKKFYEERYNQELILVNNGCDNSGEYLEDAKVNTSADYIMNDRLVEIKFSNNMLDIFRLKVSQVRSYIRQKSYILMVNGYETEFPKFKMFSTNDLIQIRNNKKPICFASWGNKECYELYAKDYTWHFLKNNN